MARDIYSNVITKAGAGGALAALANLQITVKETGTGTAATIYKGRVGAAQGPSAGSGAIGVNPFTTGASGTVEFWADAGEYELEIHDLISPPRVGDYTLGWNSIPAAVAGIPGDLISIDGRVPLAALSAQTVRQFAPLGTVEDWWRPFAAFDAGGGPGQPPPGYEIADGRTIPAANHDFGTGSPLTLPNLRNAFVLGSEISRADGQAAVVNSNLAADGPGIGGAGGAHSISVALPPHKHGLGTLATAAAGSHSHGGATGSMNRNNPHSHFFAVAQQYEIRKGADGGAGQPPLFGGNTIGGTVATDVNHEHAIGLDGSHGHTMTGQVGNVSGASGDSSFNATAQDLRPRYVGLLKIMKVKRG